MSDETTTSAATAAGASASPAAAGDAVGASAGDVGANNATDTTTPETTNATAAEIEAWRYDALPEDVAGRTVIVQVDGEDVAVPLAELTKGYMRQRGATKKFQEAAEARKEVEQAQGEIRALFDAIKSGDLSVLDALGIDSRQVSERWLSQALADEAMPPEEKERRKFETERQKFEREKREYEERRRSEAIAAETQRAHERYVSQMRSELTTAGLPLSEDTMARTAAYLESALDAGQPLTVADAVELVREDLGRSRTNVLEDLRKMSAPELIDALGEDVIRAIGKHRAEQLAKEQQNRVAPPNSGRTQAQPSTQRLTTEQLRQKLRGY